jgi:hypothetical protein
VGKLSDIWAGHGNPDQDVLLPADLLSGSAWLVSVDEWHPAPPDIIPQLIMGILCGRLGIISTYSPTTLVGKCIGYQILMRVGYDSTQQMILPLSLLSRLEVLKKQLSQLVD